MLDPEERLHEARIQIRIVAEGIDDDDINAHLERAEALLEGVRGDLVDDGSGL